MNGNKATPTDGGFRLETSSERWQTALAALPHAHVLQSWLWGQFKSRWGWSAAPLILDTPGSDGQNPLAAALVLKRRLPRTPFSVLYVPKGPLFDYGDPPRCRLVLAELEQYARRERAIFIKIDPDVVKSWGSEPERLSPIGSKFTLELRRRGWLFSPEQIQFRNTVELSVQRPEEELLAAMKQKTRYNIRLAARKGITVRAGGPADFPTIVEMYKKTAARDGFAIRPAAYYLDIWNAFYEASIAHPLLAEFEGEPVASVIVVRSGDRAIYMYGASTEKERKRMPNYLLQWEAIRWAKTQGCQVYDFWGAPDEFRETDRLWGVWRFKAGFGGQVVSHVGAWDFPLNRALYWIYTVALPPYLDWLRHRKAR